MNKKQIEKVFMDKENVVCPITDKLIAGGYRQRSGGYVKRAKLEGIDNPSQYWHLINSWCSQSEDDAPFDRRIQCGELLMWMAESTGAVSYDKLNELCSRILSGNFSNNRRRGNRMIQEVCFDAIEEMVLKTIG